MPKKFIVSNEGTLSYKISSDKSVSNAQGIPCQIINRCYPEYYNSKRMTYFQLLDMARLQTVLFSADWQAFVQAKSNIVLLLVVKQKTVFLSLANIAQAKKGIFF